MGTSTIEWTDATWNPVTGCSKVSEGCRNCYAESLARRFAGRNGYPAFEPWTSTNAEHNVTVREERLAERPHSPLGWKKPRRVFVCSMADLFHERVPLDFIARVFAVMALSPLHQFQILTKRPERMLALLGDDSGLMWDVVAEKISQEFLGGGWVAPPQAHEAFGRICAPYINPLPNVWLGISAEDQETFEPRVEHLMATPAAVRFLSLEPLLGPIEMSYGAGPVDWVIVGGESGPGARPMHPEWVSGIRDQCAKAGVPFFFKQWGTNWPAHQAYPGEKPTGKILAMTITGEPSTVEDRGHLFVRCGKKKAGRLLDGVTHDATPKHIL